MIHEKASADADKFLAEFKDGTSHFIEDLDARKLYTGRRSLSELEKLARHALDLANASRHDKAWSWYLRTPFSKRTTYARKSIRGAVRKDQREQK